MCILINPRRMREGYCSWFVCLSVSLSVCLSVCLSVTTLAATYLVCESNLRCCKVPYGVPNSWFVWISPKSKALCSPVWRHFTILSFLTLPEPAIAWLNGCALYTVCTSIILSACAVASIPPLSPQRAFDDRGFFSILRLSCLYSCGTLWLSGLCACMEFNTVLETKLVAIIFVPS